MAPDFTTYVLETLYDDWDASNAPKPIIIDRRDTSRMGAREPDREADLTENNAVSVGAAPTTNNTASTFDFQYKYEGGADVHVNALDWSEGGHVDGAGEWSALVGEVRRCLNAQRRWPIPDDAGGAGAYTLMLDNENDDSQNWQDYWRWQADALFTGREALP